MKGIVEIKQIHKSFGEKQIISGLDYTVEAASFNIITGASGSGKSTLLNMIGLLALPDSGELTLFGKRKIKILLKLLSE